MTSGRFTWVQISIKRSGGPYLHMCSYYISSRQHQLNSPGADGRRHVRAFGRSGVSLMCIVVTRRRTSVFFFGSNKGQSQPTDGCDQLLMLGDDPTLHGMHTNGNDWLHVDKGAHDGTATARAQLSHSRAGAWAMCLQSDSGTHFTTPMHYVHAQQTLMYTAWGFSGPKALKRERVKANLVSQQGGFYQPKSPVEFTVGRTDV